MQKKKNLFKDFSWTVEDIWFLWQTTSNKFKFELILKK